MADLFEAYGDLDELASRLRSADASERRIAVIELAEAGDTAAIALLTGTLSDADTSVRRRPQSPWANMMDLPLPRRSRWCLSTQIRRSQRPLPKAPLPSKTRPLAMHSS